MTGPAETASCFPLDLNVSLNFAQGNIEGNKTHCFPCEMMVTKTCFEKEAIKVR